VSVSDSIVPAMSTPKSKNILGSISPNPIITLTSETLVETIINPSSPLKSMPLGSSKKDVESTIQNSARLKPQFPIRSKSKVKVDFRPVPRKIQLEAAIDDGDLEVTGQTIDEGIPLPFTIKIEPDLETSLDPLTIESVDSPRPTTITRAASNQISASAESIPAVEPKLVKPASEQSTLLNEATGRKSEVPRVQVAVKAPELDTRKVRRAAKVQELERRKARDPTVAPAASDQKLKSLVSIPAVNPEVDNPISKQSSLLNEAMGGKFELRRSRDAAKGPENALQSAEVRPGFRGSNVENPETPRSPLPITVSMQKLLKESST
jgi:hypothetical protein